MSCGLAAGYGTLGTFAARYLYPASGSELGWQFVAVADELELGKGFDYIAPNGARVVIARQAVAVGGDEREDNFIALSSVCPHLGCQVHWESQNDRFFCPCHNGVFDPQGNPVEGPPAKAGQALVRFRLKIDNGLLFVEVPLTSVVEVGRGSRGQLAAHDASGHGFTTRQDT